MEGEEEIREREALRDDERWERWQWRCHWIQRRRKREDEGEEADKKGENVHHHQSTLRQCTMDSDRGTVGGYGKGMKSTKKRKI